MSKARDYAICALAGIGAVSSLCAVGRVLSFVRKNYLTHCDMKRKYGKAGDWAVVTGASEGIGHAMALDLGRRGFNVCVIARTQSKLDAVVEELRAVGVEGLAISFDFGTATEQDWSALFAKLDKLEIAVLINNVGINYDHTNYFEEVPTETHMRLIKVNCESSVRLTQYVVPKMKAKRCGAIVCLSSFSATTPTPMLATYASTKAFNLSLGTALYYELKPFGVDVLTLTPNMVVSKMTQGKSTRKPRETFFTVNADQMAHQSLNKTGSVLHNAGHRNHALVEAIALSLPVNYTAGKIYAMGLSTKRYVEKKNAEYAEKARQQAKQAATA